MKRWEAIALAALVALMVGHIVLVVLDARAREANGERQVCRDEPATCYAHTGNLFVPVPCTTKRCEWERP